MNEIKPVETLLEERREAWSASRGTYAATFRPVSAAEASRAFDPPPVDALEDTVPLAGYRPDRL